MTELLQFDRWLFHLINGEWHWPVLDAIMPYWREKSTWIPLYVLMAGFVIWKFRQKALFFLLAAGLTVALADTISSRVVKQAVHRLRPCNDQAVRDEVKLLIDCGPGYSFTSSHATNHFAVAVFLCLTLGAVYPRIRVPLLLWAASISYAQVYVGVHYPLDVLGGALLGTLIGYLVAMAYFRFPKWRLIG